MRGRAFAWLNLAFRFALHLLRLPLRPLARGRDAARFLDAVAREGLVPLDPAERERLPASMACIGCGLCALACPSLAAAPASAWAEPWTFVVGSSRSLDRADLAAAATPRCGGDAEPADICPAGVPIPGMTATVERLARLPRGGDDAEGEPGRGSTFTVVLRADAGEEIDEGKEHRPR